MIQKINCFITKIFDIILYPFKFVNDFWGVFFLSVLSSFVVLIIYKHVSSPKRIKEAKDKIKSNILAIRIYRDFWKVILSSFFKSLFYTLKYFILNLGPVLVIILILGPVFMQMEIRYGMRPLKIGESFVVKAKFSSDINDLNIELLKNKDFKTLMNPVFIRAKNEVNWKLETINKGFDEVEIKVNSNIYKKRLIIGDSKKALSRKKMVKSSISHFMYPVEPLLEQKGNLEYIYIKYPSKLISFLGLKIHWIIYYLIFVTIIVLALRKKFGVEF